jgi:hypothetical protein
MSSLGVPRARLLALALVRALALWALSGCGSGSAGPDASVIDANPCADVTCEGLMYCDQGACVPYPSCPVDAGMPGPDPTPMCSPGTVCRNQVCIPVDTDVDHDGHPAATDCDEQDRDVHPGAPEVCNGVDDDCSMAVDDGEPAVLCSGDHAGDVCILGTCACADGNFELDPTVPGCECVATPALDQGTSCATAIDVGDLPDVATGQTVVGNIPNGRQIWYRFRGVDSPDASCDNYHVTAKLTENPADQFRIRVSRGACGDPSTTDPITSFDWATDFRSVIHGVLTGECPCWRGTPADNVSYCQDNTADYFVVVERVTGGADTCASYSLELTNGVYDTP